MLTSLTIAAALTLGQAVPAAELEQWRPAPFVRSLRWVGTGETAKALEFRATAAGSYLVAPFRSASGSTLMSERYAVTLVGALGLTEWLELGTSLQLVPSQSTSLGFPVAAAGVGNPWVYATAAVLGEGKPLTAALSVGLGVPVGTAAALGNGERVDVHPKVVLGKRFTSAVLGVELGALIRRASTSLPRAATPTTGLALRRCWRSRWRRW